MNYFLEDFVMFFTSQISGSIQRDFGNPVREGILVSVGSLASEAKNFDFHKSKTYVFRYEFCDARKVEISILFRASGHARAGVGKFNQNRSKLTRPPPWTKIGRNLSRFRENGTQKAGNSSKSIEIDQNYSEID